MKISTITGIIVVVLLNNAENVEKVLINKLKPFHSDVSVSTDAKQTHISWLVFFFFPKRGFNET